MLLTIAISLGLESAKQGWVELIIHPGSPNLITPLPMLGDNNGVAVGMLMLVPILTVLASTATTQYERLFLRFMAFGVLYRGIVTYSRGGFLAAAALALFYILRSRRRLPALAGVLIATLLVLPVLPDTFWQRMSTIQAPNNRTAPSSETSLRARTLAFLERRDGDGRRPARSSASAITRSTAPTIATTISRAHLAKDVRCTARGSV